MAEKFAESAKTLPPKKKKPVSKKKLKREKLKQGVSAPGEHPSSLPSGSEEASEGEGSSRSALSVFKAKEEQIERKKMEVRDKVFAQLGRVEEESKRLAFIRQELEGMADPTRKEVESIQRRIDTVNRQLKPLSKSCVKKLVSESERMRMKKLEELNKTVDSLY
ncbi:hypothetical protein TRIUR3_32840 [Triticum urartu]|uniref:RAB6-interacting golgin n=1 Tax=Triticum urartu TaxID=4572 RepID=M8AFE9_TRIUA|nr:hypothetical protein TRIUR3_32840 [Triticum urartu]